METRNNSTLPAIRREADTSSSPLDWSHDGDARFTAHTYSHTLKVSRLASGDFAFIAYDLDNRLKATGKADTLELAQARAEVEAILLEVAGGN